VLRRFLRVPPFPLNGDEPELDVIFGNTDEPVLGSNELLELVLGKKDELELVLGKNDEELELGLEKKLGEERSYTYVVEGPLYQRRRPLSPKLNNEKEGPGRDCHQDPWSD